MCLRYPEAEQWPGYALLADEPPSEPEAYEPQSPMPAGKVPVYGVSP